MDFFKEDEGKRKEKDGREEVGKKSNEANELKHLISFINESCQALWFYYLSWFHDCKMCVFAEDFFSRSFIKRIANRNQSARKRV